MPNGFTAISVVDLSEFMKRIRIGPEAMIASRIRTKWLGRVETVRLRFLILDLPSSATQVVEEYERHRYPEG